jgi:hypothetical protein
MNAGRRGVLAKYANPHFPVAAPMLSKNIDTMSPSTGPFTVGDKITVYGPSKHSGRTATVHKVGRKRLTVQFHDKKGGRYVNHGCAHLLDATPVSPTIGTTTSPAADDDTTLTEDQTTRDLTAVLEQLAITTATAIKTYDPDERSLLFNAFVQSLDQYLGGTPRHNTAIAVPMPSLR